MSKINLLARTPEGIAALVDPVADRRFRGRQVASWILHRDACGFDEMTDLPAGLRRELGRLFTLDEPVVERFHRSDDGAAKYLFRLADGQTIEGVAMPENGKLTLCLSSQTGCALGCSFCVTGALGAGRNLTADEIIGQYRAMLRTSGADADRVNVVFMGMGEPLLNLTAVDRVLDVLAIRTSLKRITVSTAGVVPGIRWLAGRDRRPKLAVSLCAPDQERRQWLMPIAGRWPLDSLMEAVRSFPLERGRRITFEYVLIAGVNDDPADARATAELVRGIPSKINLIPFNEDPVHLPGLARPSPESIDRFVGELLDAPLTVTVRRSRGTDVGAACGQLKGLHQLAGRAETAAP